MLISELARAAGLTPDTIRFYEKKGLLDHRHSTRKDNNYKEYGFSALQRLQIISQAKCAGFTLTEIVQMFRDWNTLDKEEWQEIFSEKIRQIDHRIEELEKMKAYLCAIIPICLDERSGCG